MSTIREMRQLLHRFPSEYLPEISYTIEEVVGRDCYGLLSAFQKPGSYTLIDIGANFGVFSLAASIEAQRKGCPLRIVAIEPNPTTFRKLVAVSHGRFECGCHAFGDGRSVVLSHDSSPFKVRVQKVEEYTAQLKSPQGCSTAVHDTYAMPLAAVWEQYAPEGAVLLKIDCEGGESALLDDPAAAKILNQIISDGGRIGMEVHWGPKYPNLSQREKIEQATWQKWANSTFIGHAMRFTATASANVGMLTVERRP